MTPAEMEAKIADLIERTAALEQQQQAQSRHWSQCAMIARGVTILLALLLLASAVIGVVEHKTDPITAVFGATMTLVLFLSLAFARAAGTAQQPGA